MAIQESLFQEQLETIIIPIRDLYEAYQTSILEDIARRLVKTGEVTDTAAWQAQRLVESGAIYDNAMDRLADLTGQTSKELKTAFEAAGVRHLQYTRQYGYESGADQVIPLNLSPGMLRVMNENLVKTQGTLKNLTSTTAPIAEQTFIDTADLAYQQMSTGTMSWQEAVKRGIKSAAAKGLETINYDSGHKDSLDVALRRTVLTGISQTAGAMQIELAADLETDLVEVSAHQGARNEGSGPENHAGWQGKVYSISGTHPKYPSLIEKTGYGTGPGLYGWNCRHDMFPYFEGISTPAYSQKELKSLKTASVTMYGKEVSQYEAHQEQRRLERNIRAWKRQVAALEAAGYDATYERNKVKEWQQRMRDLVAETGLDRQRWREQAFENIKPADKPPKHKSPALPKPSPPGKVDWSPAEKGAAKIQEQNKAGSDVKKLVPEPKPQDPTWKPTMTQDEALEWAKNHGTKYSDIVWHITGTENANAILDEGFKLGEGKGFSKQVHLFGEGFYGALDMETVGLYQDLAYLQDEYNVSVGFAVNIQKPLRLIVATPEYWDFENNAPHPGTTPQSILKDFLSQVIGEKDFNALLQEKDALNPDAGEGELLAQILQDMGYDSIIFMTPAAENYLGGSQIVVFDPRNVVAIQPGNAAQPTPKYPFHGLERIDDVIPFPKKGELDPQDLGIRGDYIKKYGADEMLPVDWMAKTKDAPHNVFYHTSKEGLQTEVGDQDNDIGKALYVGRDPWATEKMYGLLMSPNPVTYQFEVNPSQSFQVFDIRDPYVKNLTEKVAKKEFPDAQYPLGEYAKAKGYDAIRYFDPWASGEEWAILSQEKLILKGKLEHKKGDEQYLPWESEPDQDLDAELDAELEAEFKEIYLTPLQKGIEQGIVAEYNNLDMGAFESSWVEFADGTKALKKPSPPDDFWDDDPQLKEDWGIVNYSTLSRREALAYDLDQALGLGVVPETRYSEDDNASYQLRVAYAEIGSNLDVSIDLDQFPDYDTEEYRTWVKQSEDGRANMYLFDLIAGNQDRHNGNWMSNEQTGEVYAIDNGLIFPTDTRLEIRKKKFPATWDRIPISYDVATRFKRLHREGWFEKVFLKTDAAQSTLTAKEADALLKRVEKLNKDFDKYFKVKQPPIKPHPKRFTYEPTPRIKNVLLTAGEASEFVKDSIYKKPVYMTIKNPMAKQIMTATGIRADWQWSAAAPILMPKSLARETVGLYEKRDHAALNLVGDESLVDNIAEVYLDVKKPLVIDLKKAGYGSRKNPPDDIELSRELVKALGKKGLDPFMEKEIYKEVKKAGYDAIVYKNVPALGRGFGKEKIDQVIPMDISQVKVRQEPTKRPGHGLMNQVVPIATDVDEERLLDHAASEVKDNLIKNVLERVKDESEDPDYWEYEKVNELVRQWAITSNDDNADSLRVQEAAAEVFGLDLTDWQVKKIKENKLGTVHSWAKKEWYKSAAARPSERIQEFIRATYQNTQDYLAGRRAKTIKVYRGVQTTKYLGLSDAELADLKASGDMVKIQNNALSSWSTNENVALDFAYLKDSIVIEMEVPAEYVFSTAMTGNGCLSESEVVLIGYEGYGKIIKW